MGLKATPIRTILLASAIAVPVVALCAKYNRAQPIPPDAELASRPPSAESIARLGRVVEAQAFVLRGKDGSLHGLFSAEPNGVASLTLFNKGGKAAVHASVGENGEPMFTLASTDRKTSIGLAIIEDGALLSLESRKSRNEYGMALIRADGNDFGVALHRNDRPVISMELLERQPMITLRDKNGNDVAEVFLDNEEKVHLKINGVDLSKRENGALPKLK
jgi:hypothetical protein